MLHAGEAQAIQYLTQFTRAHSSEISTQPEETYSQKRHTARTDIQLKEDTQLEEGIQPEQIHS
jgi:hypothetical protein